MEPGHLAYDRTIAVFSPDGRLFQVEYAREAVRRGTTAMGLIFMDGVVLVADKRITSPLINPESIEKIYVIDEHIGFATSGLVADARALVHRARIEVQLHKFYYGERIVIDTVVKRICDYQQSYTQFGGVRPFGAALLIGGIDNTSHLYETDPSGALAEYCATAIGERRNEVLEYFEKEYEENLNSSEAIELCLDALQKAVKTVLKPTMIEIGIIKSGEKFKKLTKQEIEKYIHKKLEE